MKYRIESLATFDKEVKRLSKRYPSMALDIKVLKADILANPSLGVSLGNNIRKIRMRIASKGKSGGARVITITVVAAIDETEIDLLYIYDKADAAT